MNVLHVNSLYAPHVGGGAEVMLAELARGFRARGQAVSVLTTHGGTGVLRDTVDGVPVYRLGNKNIYWQFPPLERSAAARTLWHALDSYNLPMARQAAALIDEIRPDLIVCHNLPSLSASVWALGKRRGIPVVQVLHDYYSMCPKVTMFRKGHCCSSPCGSCSLFRMPHRHASKAVSAVVGVSRAVLDAHLAQGMFAQARIKTVVYNARSLPPPATRQTDETFTFGYIGGITDVKGVDRLAKAFAAVARSSKRPVRLMIAGTGKPEDVARLRREHESPQISISGRVDPFDFFSRLDVSVVPSLWNEPLGLVAFEAIGSGVPVIGARRGGIPEIVQHEVNGLLFEPDEPGSLERALQRTLDEPALLQSMRAAGRASVERFLDPQRVLDEYDEIFRQLTQGRTSSAGAAEPALSSGTRASLHPGGD